MSSNFMGFSAILWCSVQFYGVQWNFMGFGAILWGSVQFYGVQCNFMGDVQFYGVQWNFMGLSAILWSSVQFYGVQCSFMVFSAILWAQCNFMDFSAILWGSVQFYGVQCNFMGSVQFYGHISILYTYIFTSFTHITRKFVMWRGDEQREEFLPQDLRWQRMVSGGVKSNCEVSWKMMWQCIFVRVLPRVSSP
jgi:hypothetical protein